MNTYTVKFESSIAPKGYRFSQWEYEVQACSHEQAEEIAKKLHGNNPFDCISSKLY
jgi:hypothetical protein